MWNDLPADTIDFSSLNSFKRSLYSNVLFRFLYFLVFIDCFITATDFSFLFFYIHFIAMLVACKLIINVVVAAAAAAFVVVLSLSSSSSSSSIVLLLRGWLGDIFKQVKRHNSKSWCRKSQGHNIAKCKFSNGVKWSNKVTEGKRFVETNCHSFWKIVGSTRRNVSFWHTIFQTTETYELRVQKSCRTVEISHSNLDECVQRWKMFGNPKIQRDYRRRWAESALYKSWSPWVSIWCRRRLRCKRSTTIMMMMIYAGEEIKSDYVDDMLGQRIVRREKTRNRGSRLKLCS